MWRVVCRIIAILAVMLWVVACMFVNPDSKPPKKNVNNPTFNVVFEKNFSGPERELIIDSLKQWEHDTNAIVKFSFAKYQFNPSIEEIHESEKGCTYDTYVTRTFSDDPEVRKLDKRENAKVLGFTTSTCKARMITFVVDRLSNSKEYRQVAFHEVGHLVGLDHIPVPNESVMFPSVDKATSFCATTLDMKQFCMLYECDWQNMKTCPE